MENLYDILNIKKVNVEEEIKDTISKTKKELANLTTIRTCKIYSSKLSEILKNKSIVHRIVDTKTKDMDYSHQFVMVPINNDSSYIIDLTFNQFKYNPLYEELYNNGYVIMNSDDLNSYLDYIEFSNLELDDYINNTRR